MTEYCNKMVKARDLKLRDVVCLANGDDATVAAHPFMWAIVNKVGEDFVSFYRPYAVSEDWSGSGGAPNSAGVICYMGLEEFKGSRGDSLYRVVQRDDVK